MPRVDKPRPRLSDRATEANVHGASVSGAKGGKGVGPASRQSAAPTDPKGRKQLTTRAKSIDPK